MAATKITFTYETVSGHALIAIQKCNCVLGFHSHRFHSRLTRSTRRAPRAAFGVPTENFAIFVVA